MTIFFFFFLDHTRYLSNLYFPLRCSTLSLCFILFVIYIYHFHWNLLRFCWKLIGWCSVKLNVDNSWWPFRISYILIFLVHCTATFYCFNTYAKSCYAFSSHTMYITYIKFSQSIEEQQSRNKKKIEEKCGKIIAIAYVLWILENVKWIYILLENNKIKWTHTRMTIKRGKTIQQQNKK